ncbi:MAG TPA: patatin-like phospholipase family protein [Albitalea sp.]|uniref:patatin-like phospholipase family protein n=1 Tax=Piscinibacter sp. TaxID=1903157 RepID=UPI002ED2F5EA
MGKRAIALAGGGPAAGLHIGALQAFEDAGIEFDVWALSCIGAWVGIVYNTRPGPARAQQTLDFFREKVFRDDRTYKWFPVNRAFAPNFGKFADAWRDFATQSVDSTLFDADKVVDAWTRSAHFWSGLQGPRSHAAVNEWWLNDVLAVNPVSRFFTSMMFRSQVNGLANIYYPDSPLLASLHIEELEQLECDIYHNAWNLDRQELQLFHNHPTRFPRKAGTPPYRPITPRSLCGCSALPFVEETVQIPDDGDPANVCDYCEGALVDTVNFKDMLEDYQDLSEIWVSRIVDFTQVRKPQSLHDALANLCMLFAAEVGANDVKLFKYHLRDRRDPKPTLHEIPISKPTQVSFDWTVSNLQQGFDEGRRAAKQEIERSRRARVTVRSGWKQRPVGDTSMPA